MVVGEGAEVAVGVGDGVGVHVEVGGGVAVAVEVGWGVGVGFAWSQLKAEKMSRRPYP